MKAEHVLKITDILNNVLMCGYRLSVTANLMIERIDLIHAGELQGIRVKWRELGWNVLIGEFAPKGIGAELLEVENP